MRHLLFLLTVLSAFTACGTSNQNPTENPDSLANSSSTHTMDHKELAIAAFDALFVTHSEDQLRELFHDDIIQHNPFVPTGLDGMLALLPAIKQANIQYTNHRLIADGDFVVMHNTLTNADAFGAPEIVTFNVYRIEDGKIAEHWPAISPRVETTASGRSQFDGATEVTDLNQTEANKAAVKNLFHTVVNGTQDEVGAMVTQLFQPDYAQHSPSAADGIPAVFEAFAREEWVYTKNHKVIGEGNFVLSISEGTAKGVHSVFYDLVRFEDGKIAEHWDIIQAIPTEGLANENGRFGF